MTTIKYFFLLIIAILFAYLVYMNSAYFMTMVSLKFIYKGTHYVIHELPNIAYFGICFLFGLLLSWINVLICKFNAGRKIKAKDAVISDLTKEIATLKEELNVFQHDPYIKKDLEEKTKTEERTENKAETEAAAETFVEPEIVEVSEDGAETEDVEFLEESAEAAEIIQESEDDAEFEESNSVAAEVFSMDDSEDEAVAQAVMDARAEIEAEAEVDADTGPDTEDLSLNETRESEDQKKEI
jgi:hypothetical protein